jgi:hypothetical protein
VAFDAAPDGLSGESIFVPGIHDLFVATAPAMAKLHPGCGRHTSVETLLKQRPWIIVFQPEGQLCVTAVWAEGTAAVHDP